MALVIVDIDERLDALLRTRRDLGSEVVREFCRYGREEEEEERKRFHYRWRHLGELVC